MPFHLPQVSQGVGEGVTCAGINPYFVTSAGEARGITWEVRGDPLQNRNNVSVLGKSRAELAANRHSCSTSPPPAFNYFLVAFEYSSNALF